MSEYFTPLYWTLLLAVQDQVLLSLRHHSRSQHVLQLCRLCDQFHETMAHITTEQASIFRC